MSDFEKLTDEELKVLFQVDPSAAPVNPWHPKYDTPKGKEIRMRFEASNPTVAAGLKQKAPGFSISARAEMYNRGLIELDKGIHEELMSNDPVYRKQKQANAADWEVKMLAKMQSEAEKMAESRGADLNSKIGIQNYDKRFGKYFSQLQQDELLEQQVKNQAN